MSGGVVTDAKIHSIRERCFDANERAGAKAGKN
jgi:hypothetical protein